MMQDKIVIVTGATNGIGEVTALELARQGAHIGIVSRSEAKCQQTVSMIQRETGNQQVDYFVADLSTLAEIRSVAEKLRNHYDRIDVLVNNAGALFNSRQLSADGYEMTFALNHLNYFLLTNLLLDRIQATAEQFGDARIVNVSSDAHQAAKGVNFDDLQREDGYSSFSVYSESKLMNILFTYELAERLADTDITVNALHPGFVRTGFGKNNNPLMTLGMKIAQIFAISPEQGAETMIYLASDPEVKGITGEYWAKKHPKQSNQVSYDRDAWRRLWEVSTEITGIETIQPIPVEV